MGDSDSQLPGAEHVWASEAPYVGIALKSQSEQTQDHPQHKGGRLCHERPVPPALQVQSSA